MFSLGFLEDFGRFLLWVPQIFRKPENWTMYYKETIRQTYDIGIGSLFIVFIISIFIGAVTAIQFSYQMEGTLIPAYYIGYIVRDMSIIASAPTITSIVLAGKVGANIASEIGGMRQKEHIDAMEIMGVNTSAYLVLPKIIGAVIAIPMLVTLAALLGSLGGYIASVPTGLFQQSDYITGLQSFFIPWNVVMMYVKALVFALIISFVSCYQGYFVRGGSIELGEASTRAVVVSDILILIADYLLAVLLTV